MNILFLIYDSFYSNSATHVHHFANAMMRRGHFCIVAVPGDKSSASRYLDGEIVYQIAEFDEFIKEALSFPNDKRPDIIHAWTPREIVRKQYRICKKKYPKSRLILHLEDNETVLLRQITSLPTAFLKILPNFLLKRIVSDLMSHPRHYLSFIKSAAGITMIMDTLQKFVKGHQPNLVLWPIIHPEQFYSIEKDKTLKSKFKIQDHEAVVVYTGNVHPSNAMEVRTLYRAIGIANREGLPTRLIRTGKNICDFLSPEDTWVNPYVVELGFVNRSLLTACLSLADIFIQPGKPGKFNDYRLPSKIPEYLATGKPVVVPNTNIGRFLTPETNALILQNGDETEIVSVLKRLTGDRRLYDRVSQGGREFVVQHFSEEKTGAKLDQFYEQVMAADSGPRQPV